jgi:V/A-type H+-transporting ATPase subunit E
MDKLQQLTDKLYQEGLSKGRQEGEALLAEAKKQAAGIVEEAKTQADAILAQARKDAADYKTKVESDLKMASAQALQATKKDIENMVVSKISDAQVAKALSAPDFIKGIITEVAKKFNAEEAADLELVLPESLKKELEPFVKNELASLLKGGVDATFSKKVSGGFTIGPKDGGYFISLTDDTFKSLVGEYLRPVTKQLLFGE